MRYGFTYLGSKNTIAKEIINALPAGRRLVDLFGGGFAISHCALLSGKWDHVWYNDINPLLVPLIRDAIAGKYNYDNFTPEFISRERFHEMKTKDGYIKYCWSFGTNGWDYLYSKEKECRKHKAHDVIFRDIPPGVVRQKRREIEKRMEHLEHLESLQDLSALRDYEIEMTTMDYRDYQYQEGDVVYCDIPYQNVADPRDYKQYGRRFDHGAFYAWAVSRPFPVYFSSFKLGGIIWKREKRFTISAQNKAHHRREVVYCVDNDFVPPKHYYQGHLFE